MLNFFILLFCITNVNAKLKGTESVIFIDEELSGRKILETKLSNQKKDAQTFHLFSHGRSAELRINGKWLGAKEIVAFLKADFGNFDSQFLHLNIYGCEFAKGKKGKQAVAYIQKETGLQVSASTNITGKDGDWILELGQNTSFSLPNYNYNLQTIGGTGDNDDYDGDGVLNIDDLDDDNDGILDTVEAKCVVSEFINNPSPACTTTGGSLEQAGVTAGTSGEDLPITVGYSIYASSINPGITRNQGVTIATICTRLTFSPFDSPLVVQGVNPLTGDQTEIGDITLQSDCRGDNEIPWVEFYDSTGAIIGSRLDVDPDLGEDECRTFNAPSGTYYVKYGNTRSGSRITNITLTGANSALCENPDTDNDGIPNHFDLDSDGDGCPDAVEGDGTLSNGQLVDSTLDGGNTGDGFTGNTGVSPVIQNLGNTVDATVGSSTLGVPNVAGSGQNVGISENKAIENCADTDGDGINDYVDIDDDNDGILDTTELGCGRGFATGQVDNSNLMSGTFTFGSASADFTNAITGAQMFTQNTRFANGVHYLVIDRTPTGEFQEVITVTSESGTVLNTILYGNEVATQNLTSANGAQDITFTWDSGGLATVVDPNDKLSLDDGATFASGTTISVDATGNSENDIWFIEFDAAFNAMMSLTVNHSANSGLSSETFGFDASLCRANDDDQDGTLNHQQLDSDGDGCSDATEAGVSGTLNDEGTLENAVAQAPYGANGLADSVETSAESGEVNYQDTYQNARDKNTTACSVDTDGDSINDDVDLDDDNDGILDSDECSNTRNFVEFAASDVRNAIGNNLPGTITGPDQNGNMVTITFSAVEGTSSSGAQVGSASTTTNGIRLGSNSRTVTGLRVEATVPMYGVQYTDFDDVDNDVAVLPNPMPDGSACPAPSQRNERDVWGIDQAGVYTILAGNLAVPTSHIASDLPALASKYEQLGVNQLIIGNPEELSCGANQEVTPNATLDDTTLNFFTPTTVFRMYGSNAAPSNLTTATTIDPVGTYRYYLSPQGCEDTDGDGIPNNLDLDSDGDGCPDAVEGDGSFTAANNDLVTDTNIAGGSTNVQQNLGSSSNNDGTPNIEGTITTDSETQGAGNAHSYGTNTECCTDAENYTAILDTDGDNIGDNCDLDDDNDGILDVDENCVATSEAIHNGTTSFDSDETSTGTTVTVSTQQVNANVGVIGPYDPPRSFVFNGQQRVEYTSAVQINPDATSNETIITYTFSNPILASEVGIMIEDIDRGTPTGLISVSGGTATTADFSVQSVLRNGASGESPEINYNSTTGGIDFPSAPSSTNRYASLISGHSSKTLTELRLTISNLGNGGSRGDNVRIYLVPIVNCNNDLDSDGIENYLDLDSDGDGCPDAIEGDGNFDQDDLEASSIDGGNTDTGDGAYSGNSGPVASNLGTTVDDTSGSATFGVPIVSPATAAVTQGVGNSQSLATIEVTTQPQNQEFCENALPQTVSFTAEATATPADGLAWQWEEKANGATTFTSISGENGTGASASLSVSVTSTSQNGTTYRVGYTSTNMQCPEYSNEAALVVETPIVPTIMERAFCSSDSPGQITASPSGGVFSGGSFITSAGVFDPQAAGIGNHQISYTYTSANGCVSDPVTATISVTGNPSLQLPTNPICVNADPEQFVVSPSGGVFSGPGVSASGIFTPATAGVGIHTITYTLDSASGCPGVASEQVIVIGEPTIKIAEVGPLCLNEEEVQLSATPSGGTYSGNGVSAAGVFTPATAGVGTHTITYTVTKNGCEGTKTMDIEVLNSAVLTATPTTQTICSGDTATIAIAGDNGATINWSTDQFGLTGTGGPITQQLNNNGLEPYTVTFTITAVLDNCIDETTAMVTVNPHPTVNPNPNSAIICDFEDLTVVLSSPLSGTTIAWTIINDSDSSIEASGTGTDSLTISQSGLASGNYTLQYTGTNNGCTSQTYNLPITIN